MGDNKRAEEFDVIRSVMKLSRAMRRRPPTPPEKGMVHPGVQFLLSSLAENDGASARELAETLDIRPSSLTEMLTRVEKAGLVERFPDDADKRVIRVKLTEEGRAVMEKNEQFRRDRAAKAAACFTEEETAQFCKMCDTLSEHLEKLAAEESEQLRANGMPPCGRGCGGHHHGHHGPHGGHGPHGRHGGPGFGGPGFGGPGFGDFPPPPPEFFGADEGDADEGSDE